MIIIIDMSGEGRDEREEEVEEKVAPAPPKIEDFYPLEPMLQIVSQF
jgi:hypothetical protein